MYLSQNSDDKRTRDQSQWRYRLFPSQEDKFCSLSRRQQGLFFSQSNGQGMHLIIHFHPVPRYRQNGAFT